MKILISTLALLIASTLIAAEPAEKTVDQITAIVDKAVAEDRFSGVVMLAKDGTPLLSRAWGMA
ncbi:MAG: hypothetical protein ACRD3J_09535, partial [Thermoanaerobaculia bacterium]